MDVAILSAVIGAASTIIATMLVIGQARATRLRRVHESVIAELRGRIEGLTVALSTKSEALTEMRSQRDILVASSEIQDRIWTQVEARLETKAITRDRL